MTVQPERCVTLERDDGPPVVWTVTVDGRVRYHGPSAQVAHWAYLWAATMRTPGC
jgi:hypothetical protein